MIRTVVAFALGLAVAQLVRTYWAMVLGWALSRGD